MTIETRSDKLELVGGRLCLDFTNTTSGQRVAGPNDRLTSYLELVTWGKHVGVLSGEESERLLAKSEQHPAEAEEVLRRAIALREAIYGVFSSKAVGVPHQESNLAILNEELSAALPHRRLASGHTGYEMTWEKDDELDQILWPVADSAAELLTSGELERVRECGGPTCTWLFVDMTKNHSRRWCDMKDCGNRAKARRHYAKGKEGREGTEGM